MVPRDDGGCGEGFQDTEGAGGELGGSGGDLAWKIIAGGWIHGGQGDRAMVSQGKVEEGQGVGFGWEGMEEEERVGGGPFRECQQALTNSVRVGGAIRRVSSAEALPNLTASSFFCLGDGRVHDGVTGWGPS